MSSLNGTDRHLGAEGARAAAELDATADQITADDVYRATLGRFDDVGAEELGVVYQELMDPDGRKGAGSYYTPEPLAVFLTRFSLDLGLDKVGPDPAEVLRLTALDPSCGAGIMLVHAVRLLSHAYATRLLGAEPSGDLIVAVMPQVALSCVFGVDTDPTAVDLARLAVSLETGGTLTPSMLTRHIVCDSVLDGPGHLPPALADRQSAADAPCAARGAAP